MKVIFLATALCMSGCITLGSTGWIAQHSLEIGQVAAVAGTVSAVEGAALNTMALADKLGGDEK